jgi:hypothetical protein
MSAQDPKPAEGSKQDFIHDIFFGYSSKDKAGVCYPNLAFQTNQHMIGQGPSDLVPTARYSRAFRDKITE